MGTYTKEQLTNELNRIKTATSACRDAIYNKGVTSIPADASLGSLATYASMITCGHPDILLDYIQADETPSSVERTTVYFKTDYYPDSSTDIEISYQNTFQYSSTVSSYTLIGCTHTTGGGYSFTGDHYIMAPAASNSTAYAFRYRNGSNFSIPASTPINTNRHTIRSVTNGKSQSVYYDNVLLASGTTNSLVTFELPLCIFANNTNGNPATYALKGTRIYYIKIWREHNLERFYIPVLHYYNGQYTPCFYDKVNDNYIYNLGSGTVTYSSTGDYLLDYLGPDEETAVPVTQSSYLRYETGIVADTTIQIDTKFRLLWGRENYIYGSATDSTTTPTWQTFGIGYPGNLTTLRAMLGADASNSRVVNMTTVGLLSSCTTSHYYENDIGKCYLNKTLFSGSSNIINFSSNTIHIFSRHGNSQNVAVRNGARLYYCLISKSGIVQRSYVPVLHNGSPYLLDLNNGTYNSPVAPAITVTYSVLE